MPSYPEILEAIPVIVSLVIIEGLLSVDNALAIASMANHLPHRQKYLALRLGIIGAYLFRIVALTLAAYIIDNPWLKIGGAAYLIYLMSQHFTEHSGKDGKGDIGSTVLRGFWATVVAIELMDLSLSVDNVVAAVALSPKLWVVFTGVFIGMLALCFVAGWCVKLIERFPILEDTAFLLIGYVGWILVYELTTNHEVNALQKFIGIAAIVAVTILYSRNAPLRRAAAPFLKIALWPMKVVSIAVGSVLWVICWPCKAAAGAIKKTQGSR